ncbi:MAG TPA: hypothetical protein VNU26_00815, partial [Mycobacteriales bacterium]|nr:hypothetical protein [Mycobacteriales bacterium]
MAAVVAVLGLVWSALALWAPGTVDLAAGEPRVEGDGPVRSVPEYGPGGTTVIGYRHGQQVQITVPLRNEGPLPVTV